MRLRQSSTLVLSPSYNGLVYKTSPPPTSTLNGGWYTGEEISMYDVVTPDFKKKSRRGDVIISPMQRYRDSFSAVITGHTQNAKTLNPPAGAVISASYTSLLHAAAGPQPRRSVSGLAPYNLVSDAERSSLTTLASTDALAGWEEASVQSLVILAEAKKTLATLRRPLKALTDEIRKGALKGFTIKGALRGASNQYLTWFYGIRTIMFDIEGILKALKSLSSCQRSTSRSQQSDTWTDSTSATSDAGAFKFTITTNISHMVKIRAGLIGDVNMNLAAERAFGFNLGSVPSSIWELIPWSFVLDWIGNMGDFIGSLTADTTTGVKGQWIVSQEEITVRRAIACHNVVSSWALAPAGADQDIAVYRATTRSPVNLADYRGITIRTGFMRVPELAALALALQQFTKR